MGSSKGGDVAKGRSGLFGRKDGGMWISGLLSKDGLKFYNQQKARLILVYQSVYGEKPRTVSKADVLEFGLRGEEASRQYFERLKG